MLQMCSLSAQHSCTLGAHGPLVTRAMNTLNVALSHAEPISPRSAATLDQSTLVTVRLCRWERALCDLCDSWPCAHACGVCRSLSCKGSWTYSALGLLSQHWTVSWCYTTTDRHKSLCVQGESCPRDLPCLSASPCIGLDISTMLP